MSPYFFQENAAFFLPFIQIPQRLIQSLEEWNLRLTNNYVSIRHLRMSRGNSSITSSLVLHSEYKYINLGQQINYPCFVRESQAGVKNMWQTDYNKRCEELSRCTLYNIATCLQIHSLVSFSPKS